MSIKPICNRCGKELTEFGALLFAPPQKRNSVKKYHLCRGCFKLILKTFKN